MEVVMLAERSILMTKHKKDSNMSVLNSPNQNPTFNHSHPTQIGQRLNLREHHVRNTEYLFSTPVDLEAHNGKDGRTYLVDFGFAHFPHQQTASHQ